MNNISFIILGAGLGKRMKSNLAKVLHPVAGIPMILYPVDVARCFHPQKIIVVIGFQADKVSSILPPDVDTVYQAEQKGTAHAVSLAFEALDNYRGKVVVLCGDVPLITKGLIEDLLDFHKGNRAVVTVLTASVEDPSGYGRIVRDGNGDIMRIVEDSDASRDIKRIDEINTGMYIFESEFFTKIIQEVKAENRQGEFYLTDTIEIARKKGLRVCAFKTDRVEEVMGVNTRMDLACAENIMRQRINKSHMLNGVTIINPLETYIERDVRIGQDVVIYPGVFLQGDTAIGEGTVIYPHTRVINSCIGKNVIIKDSCVIEESRIDDEVQIGPFARIRPGTKINPRARIGNFVELKKVTMGEGSKANHLTYLGDAEVGKDVNIGAGTITCNYDGWDKHRTIIGNRVFVGSDVQMVAPVKIEDDVFIAAGTTVTRDVPSGSLAIGRVDQKNIEGWVHRRRKNKEARKKNNRGK